MMSEDWWKKYRPAPGELQDERMLYCPTEKTETKHVLNRSKSMYVCACGEQIIAMVVRTTDGRWKGPK